MLRRSLVCLPLSLAFLFSISLVGATAQAAPPAAGPQPVEDSMHEFMEYVFEPAYKRLRTAMAVAEPDRATFKAIKGDALTLAEAGNLLLIRTPDEEGDAWMKLSIEVRQRGADLYQAARGQDAAGAKKAYQSMLTSCNACHTKFAGGEHQLAP